MADDGLLDLPDPDDDQALQKVRKARIQVSAHEIVGAGIRRAEKAVEYHRRPLIEDIVDSNGQYGRPGAGTQSIRSVYTQCGV